MKKYKLFRFGHCYINREGSFAIGLLRGDKRHGYQFAASYANPILWLGKIQVQSRIVPNDGNWTEINNNMFKVASASHIMGYTIRQPSQKGKLPLLSKKY